MSQREWLMFPSKWIQQGELSEFGMPKGAAQLKVLLAMAILRGRWERDRQKEAEVFPASLTDLTDIAHVRREECAQLVDDLVRELKVVELIRGKRAGLERVDPRTNCFRFNLGGVVPFFKFPFLHIEESGFLSVVRGGSNIGLAALKVYLCIGAYRDNQSGIARIGYEGLARRTGSPKARIRSAIGLLAQYDLIAPLGAEEGEDRTYRYFLRGLGDRAVTRLRDEAG